MRPAAEQLAARLKETALQAPQGIDIYSVDLRKHGDPDGIRAALVDQLVKPVRWADTVRSMLGSGVRTFVECGPGKVLTSLNRRIERDRTVRMLALEDAASVAEALGEVASA